MATLNFKGAYQFSITGGIYSEARHVTMISSSADPRGTISRGYYRRARQRPRSSRSQAGARPPSPSSSESSSISSDNSYQSRQSTPPTSADEHENSSSQAVPPISHERPGRLSPLSSRLGAMPGFRTPADLQTPVASRPADLPRSPDGAIISHPNEAPTLVQSHTPPHLHRQPGRDVGVRSRPQGPRSRPLPHPPPSSQFAHRGTPADLLSLTGSHSHTTESSSWDSFVQEPPHAFMRASTTPSTSSTLPLQPFHFSPRSRQADMFAHVNYPSRSSPSQAFLTSPLQEPFAVSMSSPSRRSVQSPPPNRPLRLAVPLPPRSAPPRTYTASRSHATIRSTYSTRSPPQAFWPSSTEQLYHSYVGPMNYPEMDVQSPTLYQYPSQDQISPNQDYFYIPSSGIPHQYMPRSPYVAGGFAYDPPSPYPLPLQSERPFHEHGRGSNNGPFLSSPRY